MKYFICWYNNVISGGVSLAALCTKETAAQNEVALSYHIVRGICFLTVIFVATIVISILITASCTCLRVCKLRKICTMYCTLYNVHCKYLSRFYIVLDNVDLENNV